MADCRWWDAQGFREAFVAHTRNAFTAAQQQWTRDIEQVVQGAAPGRWRDIERVLREAERIGLR